MGRWIGIATAAASRFPLPDGSGFVRDSAPRIKPPHVSANPIVRRKRVRAAPRPAELGGHMIRKRRGCVFCVACRESSNAPDKFAAKRCPGSAVLAWAERACRDAAVGATDGGGHARRLTGGILWCDDCGAYADKLARGLTRACRKRPHDTATARRRDRLRARKHPITGEELPGATVFEPSSFLDGSEFGLGIALPSTQPGSHASGHSPSGLSARGLAVLERVRSREAAAGRSGVADLE